MKQTNGQFRSKTDGKRTANRPYPVQVEANYLLRSGRRIVDKGRVQTVTVSQTELVLDSAKQLPPGLDIELTLQWPMPTDSSGRVAVRVKGRTARQANRTTVQIGGYDFAILPQRNAKPSAPQRATAKTPLGEITPIAS